MRNVAPLWVTAALSLAACGGSSSGPNGDSAAETTTTLQTTTTVLASTIDSKDDGFEPGPELPWTEEALNETLLTTTDVETAYGGAWQAFPGGTLLPSPCTREVPAPTPTAITEVVTLVDPSVGGLAQVNSAFESAVAAQDALETWRADLRECSDTVLTQPTGSEVQLFSLPTEDGDDRVRILIIESIPETGQQLETVGAWQRVGNAVVYVGVFDGLPRSSTTDQALESFLVLALAKLDERAQRLP